jgi:hypothetical protein
MIIGNKFVFIHNPRTGGSFVRNSFKKIFPSANFSALEDWHKPIDLLDKRHKNKLKFGVIRNPWSWYVSWYHHQQPKGKWLTLFLNGKSNTFRNFLTGVLSSSFARKNKGLKFHPVGNPYLKPSIPVLDYISNLGIGFVTYRYLYMFFNNYENIFYGKRDIWTNHNKLLSLDCVIKNENIANDIIKVFNQNNILLSSNNKGILRNAPRRNITNHKPYQTYYDEELVQLVGEKDKLVIDRYKYKF